MFVHQAPDDDYFARVIRQCSKSRPADSRGKYESKLCTLTCIARCERVLSFRTRPARISREIFL